MTTATRTRSINQTFVQYMESHIKLRRKQAEAGEIADPDKVNNDGKLLEEFGKQLQEIAELAKRNIQPVEKSSRMITNSDVEAQLRKQLAETQSKLDQLQKTAPTAKKRGRPFGSKNKKSKVA